MARVVSMTFDADMASSIRQFQQLLTRVREVEGGMKRLTRGASEFTNELERGSPKFAKSMKGIDDVMQILSNRLTTLVVGGGLFFALQQSIANVNARLDSGTAAWKRWESVVRDVLEISEGGTAGAEGALIAQAKRFGVSPEQVPELSAARKRMLSGGMGEADTDALARLLGAGAISPQELQRFADAMIAGQRIAPGVAGKDFLSALMVAGKGRVPDETLLDPILRLVESGRQVGEDPLRLMGTISGLGQRVTDQRSLVGGLRQVMDAIIKEGFADRGGLAGGLAAMEAERPKAFKTLTAEASTREVIAALRASAPEIAAAQAAIGADRGAEVDRRIREAEARSGQAEMQAARRAALEQEERDRSQGPIGERLRTAKEALTSARGQEHLTRSAGARAFEAAFSTRIDDLTLLWEDFFGSPESQVAMREGMAASMRVRAGVFAAERILGGPVDTSLTPGQMAAGAAVGLSREAMILEKIAGILEHKMGWSGPEHRDPRSDDRVGEAVRYFPGWQRVRF